MKQTAVEQLGIAFRQWQKDWYNFEETGKNKPVSYDEFIKPFLEMEKQQQGYSEEEVLKLLLNCPTNTEKETIEWFEQFKNK
jgi:hypothetical protein